MRSFAFVLSRTLFSAVLSAGFAGAAVAGPVNLNYTTTSPDGISVVTANTGAAYNALAVPGSHYYGHSFTSPTQKIPGSPGIGYGFYDDYIFTISGATANSITTTIDMSNLLQISNLQERIYSLAGNAVPTLGAPLSGTMIQAWSSPIGSIGTAAVISNVILNPGTYVLEIRGNVTGDFGGSYAGTLNLTAVPLPAALPLLLSGLGLLAGIRRRKPA